MRIGSLSPTRPWAGLPPFDFSCMEGKNRNRYFAAVQSGMAGNYNPMESVFKDVISTSLV